MDLKTLPLSPAVFAILLSLSEGEKHGYAMMKDALKPEFGAITLGPGTLYGTIDRLMRDRLIEESGNTDHERRRYYRLTQNGLKSLTAEMERLNAAIAQGRKLGLIQPDGAA
jgi:DNA-binding PadR family transcriptional regulator